MAKGGLKTFPLAVDIDDNFKLVEAEFGVKGYAVVIKLFQAIHSRGYYMKWDIDTELLFIRDYCLSEVGRNLVSEIVACCIRRGVFESTLYEKYSILTSEWIQETYLTATRRNTEVIIEEEYALPIVYKFIDNVSKNGKNVNIFIKNADSFEQKKIKEKKEKENKGKESTARARDATPLEDFLERWQINSNAIGNYKGGKLSSIDWEKLSEKVEQSKSFLQKQKSLSFYIEHYEKILDGAYDDWQKEDKEVGYSPQDYDATGLGDIKYE